MVRQFCERLFRLSRIDSSALAALTIFIPVAVHSNSITKAIYYSLPIFLSSMMAFVINDVHDIERDKVNHPERILPSGELSLRSAVIIYYVILIFTLVSINQFAPFNLVFYYVTFLLLAINYNYIIDFFPLIKTVYVAIAATVPVIISQLLINFLPEFWVLPLSLFLFILSREILMDINDIKGDRYNIASIYREKYLVLTSFSLQLFSALALFCVSQTLIHRIVVFFVISIVFANYYLWKIKGKRDSSISMMKLQMAACIILLTC